MQDQENQTIVSDVYDLTADDVKSSTVYTFAMAKVVNVQVRNVQTAVSIHADKAEQSGRIGNEDFRLIISKGEQKIGEFNGNVVDGWWISDSTVK